MLEIIEEKCHIFFHNILVQQEDTILKYNADNVIETITRPTKILGKIILYWCIITL